MKILVYLMSLNGEHSITLQSFRCLSSVYSKNGDTFDEIIMSKNGSVSSEVLEKFKDADLIIFATSMYHFIIASQAMEAMSKIGEYLKDNCPNKNITYFMTSNYFLDNLVHDYIKKWADHYEMHYIKGISLGSVDIIEDKYRADTYAWFNNIKAVISTEKFTVNRSSSVRIVFTDESIETNDIAEKYSKAFEEAGASVKEIHMSKYDFKPCLGCQACYTTRKCCIKDQFNQLAQDIEAGADIIVYVGVLDNGFYSPLFKRYMDRHVCIGRCPYNDETIMVYSWHKGLYYLDGDAGLLKTWATANTSFGGEILIDICEGFKDSVVKSAVVAFNENIGPYRDFYKVAIHTRFAALASDIRNVEPLDFKYFASNGDYKKKPINDKCRAISSVEDAKMAVEMKSMPIKMYLKQGDLSADIPERRKDKDKSLIERAINPPYANYEVTDADMEVLAPPPGPPMQGPPPQAIAARKIGKRMGLIMNTFNTIVFSTIGTLNSGHFTWRDWFIGACVGWITGAVITSFFPPKEIQDKVLAKFKLDEHSFKGKIAASLTTNAIIMPAMSIVMGVAMPMMAAQGIQANVEVMESEIIELYQQQSDLKGQQADLINQQTELKAKREALITQQDDLKEKMEVTIAEAVDNAIAEREKSIEDLNSSIEELQGQYDTMKKEVDTLQKQVDEAKTPAEKGPLQGQLEGKTTALAGMENGIKEQQNAIKQIEASIDSTKEEIEESIRVGTEEKPGMQSGIDEMQKGIDEMQSGIDEMQGGIDGMQEGIDGMQNGIDGKSGGVAAQKEAIAHIKGSISKSLPISTLLMTIIGIILGFITQPFFTKIVTRSVLGKDAEMPGGNGGPEKSGGPGKPKQ